jgi:acyl carrier protein
MVDWEIPPPDEVSSPDLSEDARIIEDVGLASLDLLELSFELEKVWNAQMRKQCR